jgi:hypothetical protein
MHKINHFVELDVKGGRIEVIASIIVKSFPTIFYHLGTTKESWAYSPIF